MIKIIIAGDAEVGKTQIFNLYLDDKFNDYYLPTIGAEKFYKSFTLANKKLSYITKYMRQQAHFFKCPTYFFFF